jgi:maleylacetate reductase
MGPFSTAVLLLYFRAAFLSVANTRHREIMEPPMRSFIYTGLPTRVLFGFGTRARLADEARALGLSRVLVLSTPQQRDIAAETAAALGALCAGMFDGATMHTPVEVTDRAMALVRECGADGTVAVGGGSTIGLGKAIALRTDLLQLVLPTTYAGSEMTPIIGETQDGRKTTQRTLKVLPETVIYDVDLTMSLPPALSGTSGINAIAHAVEALYAEQANPVIALMAEEGIAALGRSLPRLAAAPADAVSRSDALYGAWLCGICLGSVGMALHHKLCHVLGGAFDLPHAETHTIVLPHAVAYNAAAREAMTRAARALGAADAASALFDLAGAVGAKRGLRDIGMPEAGIETAADLAIANPYFNPRPLERDAIRDLIARAWAGDPPAQ